MSERMNSTTFLRVYIYIKISQKKQKNQSHNEREISGYSKTIINTHLYFITLYLSKEHTMYIYLTTLW